jgi:hypothetical protein
MTWEGPPHRGHWAAEVDFEAVDPLEIHGPSYRCANVPVCFRKLPVVRYAQRYAIQWNRVPNN